MSSWMKTLQSGANKVGNEAAIETLRRDLVTERRHQIPKSHGRDLLLYSQGATKPPSSSSS